MMPPTSQTLTAYPYGWFVVGYSTDIHPGQIIRRHLFGCELVLFRTESGKAALVNAHCPHLGAHLGYGGKIEGESIRCPFHGFCFNTTGKCISTLNRSKSLPKANLKTWHLVERGGFLFTYFDPNSNRISQTPRFELPILDVHAYTKIKGGCFSLRTYPQEILENSVDFSHLSALHGFNLTSTEAQIKEQGPILIIDSEIERLGPLFARHLVRATYKTFIFGLGISYVDVHIQEQNIQFRLFGMVTPIDPGTVEFRLAVQLRRIVNQREIHPLLVLLPKRWIEAMLLREAYRAYAADVSKDFPIWQNKIYISSPAPAHGNGPILRYRAWARQFYT